MSWVEAAVREDAPLVALEPCPAYRIPMHGDLMTCAACGWWISDHEVTP